MSRKSLIFCLVALAVLILGTGTAVAFLYSGVGDGGRDGNRAVEVAEFPLLSAVPSDAVMLACLSQSGDAPAGVFGKIVLPQHALKSASVVSLHYSAGLVPLYVFDAGRASSEPSEDASSLMEALKAAGMLVEYMDCGESASGKIAQHSVIIASPSETLLKSSHRHLSKSVSVMDSPGFAAASSAVSGDNMLFISNTQADKLLPAVVARPYSSYSGFFSRIADWTVMEMDLSDKAASFRGTVVHDGDLSRFINVLEKSSPAVSSVSEILPSYTSFAASLPLGDMDSYADAYRIYLDSRQAMQKNSARQKELAGKLGISPSDFFKAIDIKEVATASFASGGVTESVNLIKAGDIVPSVVFKGTDIVSMKDYKPSVHSWPYAGFVASVFGDMFSLKDETCFTCIGEWIITGSMKAVDEYAGGRALEYTLAEYMADASQEDLLAGDKHSFVSYFSFNEDHSSIDRIFKDAFLDSFGEVFSGAEYCPAVLTVTPGKDAVALAADILKLTLQKTKAPVFERDTVVVVPKGPFEVKNSGTGKMNKFYQNSHLSICLSEGGRDLWGVPFDKPLCGTAHNIDYYANGKLQILFGAGSKIYLIDRLGRYVKGFPVELGKDILLGPDVYDFNGVKKYNIIVLHKDNTIEMYNLKGQKPSSWKGIDAPETVKSLPERIAVGGNSFWVVRTSIRTLIYPFYGGASLTSFEGDHMIRPDSEIKVVDASSVEVVCYDGKRRTVSLK